MSEFVDANEAPVHARLRSGTAARLAGLPVTTLRVWERRYGVVAAPKTVTGQRLYSPHDVQRLRLLRQLTDRGHAIGTVATLALEPLLALMAAETPAAPAAAQPAPAFLSAVPRDAADDGAVSGGEGTVVVVVGRGAALRLGTDTGTVPWTLVVHEDLDAAELRPAAVQATEVLLVHLPSLQPVTAERVLLLAANLRARSVIVTYAFGAGPPAAALRAAGVVLRRDPVDGAELRRLISARRAGPSAAAVVIVPRRFSDEALVELAEMPSAVACECPRHLAEIVMQLSGFERYSAECGSRSPADSALHRHLSHLAGTARAQFEEALARVVFEEGLVLTHR